MVAMILAFVLIAVFPSTSLPAEITCDQLPANTLSREECEKNIARTRAGEKAGSGSVPSAVATSDSNAKPRIPSPAVAPPNQQFISSDEYQEPRGPQFPQYTIGLKSGAGSILADRVWDDGKKICWVARGIHNCTPRSRISYIRDSGGLEVSAEINTNLPTVTSASIETGANFVRFFGEVRAGNLPWSGSLIVRFYEGGKKFMNVDTVQITPHSLQPGQYGTFSRTVGGDKPNIDMTSELLLRDAYLHSQRGIWTRIYSFK